MWREEKNKWSRSSLAGNRWVKPVPTTNKVHIVVRHEEQAADEDEGGNVVTVKPESKTGRQPLHRPEGIEIVGNYWVNLVYVVYCTALYWIIYSTVQLLQHNTA